MVDSVPVDVVDSVPVDVVDSVVGEDVVVYTGVGDGVVV